MTLSHSEGEAPCGSWSATSLSQIRASMDGIHMQVFEVDDHRTIVWANQVATKFLGKSVEQLLGTDAAELFAPDQRDRVLLTQESDRSLDADTHRRPVKLDMFGKDGRRHTMEVIRSVIRGKSGRLRAILLMLHDVTESEQELVRSKARADDLQAVVDASGDLYARVDGNGICLDCRVPRVSPIPLPEGGFVGKSLFELHPEAMRGIIAQALADATENSNVILVEIKAGRENASALEMHITPLADGHFAFVIRDVTSRHERQARLAESEARLRSVMNGLPLGLQVYSLDSAGRLRLTAANPAADEITGVDHDRFIGEPVAKDHPPLMDAEHEAVYSKLASDGGVHETPRIDGTSAQSDGRFEVRAFQSTPNEVCVLIGDITERERQREKEAAYRDRLKALAAEVALAEDRERSRLAQQLHDRVSQALAVSRMHLRQAQVDLEDGLSAMSDTETALRLLDTAINETRSLTTELFPPVLEELGLAAAAVWLCEESESLFGLQCTPTISDSVSELDKTRQVIVFRAARELIANVARHSGGTVVLVELSPQADDVVLRVQDDGVGFDLAEDGRDARAGFGLFSLRERIEQLGGSLEVTSPGERGSLVTVRVPFA